jgi:hypothetical protein
MMEWVERLPMIQGDPGWWELRCGEEVLATAWKGGNRGWWAFGFDFVGEEAASLDDAKDAAWAAVYRSTR